MEYYGKMDELLMNCSLTHTETNKETRKPLKGGKNISFHCRQPSFISLIGRTITKEGEELGREENIQSPSSLDLINMKYNGGEFSNPIIVVEKYKNNNPELYSDQYLYSDPVKMTEKMSKADYNDLKKKTIQRLYQRNKEFWKKIGYNPEN